MERIAVIGVGKLGLCLALNLERAGYMVTAIDIAEEYVSALNDKMFVSSEPQVNEYLATANNFRATTDMADIFVHDIAVVFIVVPTPSLSSGSFDHTAIDNIVSDLTGRGPQSITRHLVISSTTMPGYCHEMEQRLAGSDFSISYNPEFIAQGSIIYDQQYPDQILIGSSDEIAAQNIEYIYRRMCSSTPVFCHMPLTSAEIVKLATNCFLTTKIAFANAVGDLAIAAGADPGVVLKAVGMDKRIGNRYMEYGYGYGGPCFPRDNKAFAAFGRQKGAHMFLAEATDSANNAHNAFLIQQWLDTKSPDEVLEFSSVTYKRGTDMIEESQQLRLAVALATAGRKVLIRESASVVKQLIDVYGELFIYEIEKQNT